MITIDRQSHQGKIAQKAQELPMREPNQEAHMARIKEMQDAKNKEFFDKDRQHPQNQEFNDAFIDLIRPLT